jgi:4'-phosphopantetheinyl transferase
LGRYSENAGFETSQMRKNRAMSDFNSWALDPGQVELGENEVHVWRAYLDYGEAALRQFEATLAPDEIARANRFLFQRDRNSFVATRGILRELLGRYVNRSPGQIEFDYCPKGKPLLREPLESPVQFNVSHSHGLALLTFALGRHLGVDVELVRPDFSSDEIAAKFFSTQEVIELQALPPSLRTEGFFLCWTLKEAYVKARGEGLQIPLDSFHVSFTPGQPERLQSSDSFRWSVRSLRPAPRYVGALVGEGGGWRPRFLDWKPQSCR